MRGLFGVQWSFLVFLFLCASELPASAQDMGCVNAVRITYLLTIEDGSGVFASRAIMSLFSEDGEVLVTDSRRQIDRFGLQVGVLSCNGEVSARSVTLDFGRTEANGKQDIARNE